MSRCSVALLLIAWPAAVAAAPDAPLVVLPDADAKASPPGLDAVGGARLARRAFYAELGRIAARRRLTAGKQAQQRGTRAVAELRHDQAAAALREALGHYAAAQQLPEACRAAYGAARELSFLHWQRQRPGPARRWRAAASRLAATAIDPTRYQPAFVAFWKATDHPPAVPVTFSAAGDGATSKATVRINCREVGAAPAATRVTGAALVQISAGAASTSTVIAPKGSRLVRLPLAASPVPAPPEACRALLDKRGAAKLLWLRREGRDWVADRFTPAGGWQRNARRFAARKRRPASETGSIPASPEPRPRSRVVGWALGAGAVAALAAGVISAVVARGAGDEIERKAKDGEVFDPADESTHGAARTTAYVSLAVGGALAVATVVYWVWRARRAPDRQAAGARLTPSGLTLSW